MSSTRLARGATFAQGVASLRRFHVESVTPVVHDDGGPVPLPAPSPPGTLPPLPPVGGVGPIA